MKICLIKKCSNKVKAQGFCATHYSRWWRNGDPAISLNPRGSHGMYQTAEYRSLEAMIRRCYVEKATGYKYYGGRGIKVSPRWITSFKNFFEDMGKKPSKDHSIDRVNCDGDYVASNCRWATKREQNLNRRKRK